MSGFPFDRKAMEAERLARLESRKKRERSISPPPVRNPRNSANVRETTTNLSSGARLNFIFTPAAEPVAAPSVQIKREPSTQIKSESPSEIKSESPAEVKSESSAQIKRESPSWVKREVFTTTTTTTQQADPAMKYPNGVIKKTWAFGHDRSNDIKIEEVLEPLTLKIAVLSAFQWDTEWVLSKLRPRERPVKCIFVMEAKERELRKQILEDIEPMRGYLRVNFPPMDSAWCMHSKLMLLFHPTKLRVAIPTANLLPFDWGENGIMENTVFMIDLPRLPQQVKQTAQELSMFGQELLHYIGKQGLDADIRDGLLKFDFSATKHMSFVHSVGGTSFESDAHRTGLLGLAKAVQDLNLATSADLEIDFAASSIGSLKVEYLQTLHAAARGQDLINLATSKGIKTAAAARKTFFQKRSSTAAGVDTATTATATATPDIRRQIRVYFPTAATVRASRAGAAGTICLQRRWFEHPTFPREIFRDYVSTRKGLLSHNKILCARGTADFGGGGDDDDEGGEGGSGRRRRRERSAVAWVYVGSANMSMSAWGTVGKKDPTGKISCRNWECGVLLPVVGARTETGVAVEEEEEEVVVDVKVEEVDEVSNPLVQPRLAAPSSSSVRVKQEIGDDSETESDESDGGGDQSRHGPGDVRASRRSEEESKDDSSTESDEEVEDQQSRTSSKQALSRHMQAMGSLKQPLPLPGMDVFKSVIDLPFMVPGEPYNDREPWYFTEQG